MPKINVYLPAGLALEVRALELPISSICQDALRTEVTRTETSSDTTSSPKAIAARLLLTKKVNDDDNFVLGFEAGSEWAREVASLQELEKVARRSKNAAIVINIKSVAPSLIGFLLDRFPEQNLAHDDFDELDIDKPFDRGLVDGAVETYDTVQPYLERANTRSR